MIAEEDKDNSNTSVVLPILTCMYNTCTTHTQHKHIHIHNAPTTHIQHMHYSYMQHICTTDTHTIHNTHITHIYNSYIYNTCIYTYAPTHTHIHNIHTKHTDITHTQHT